MIAALALFVLNVTGMMCLPPVAPVGGSGASLSPVSGGGIAGISNAGAVNAVNQPEIGGNDKGEVPPLDIQSQPLLLKGKVEEQLREIFAIPLSQPELEAMIQGIFCTEDSLPIAVN